MLSFVHYPYFRLTFRAHRADLDNNRESIIGNKSKSRTQTLHRRSWKWRFWHCNNFNGKAKSLDSKGYCVKNLGSRFGLLNLTKKYNPFLLFFFFYFVTVLADTPSL